MTTTPHEACVVQPAHQFNQMDLRQVRDVAGIRYLQAGSDEAPPILFLHGTGGSARAFAGQLDHFGDRFRAIAWDMPGYAGSVPLPLVTMASLAASLAGFIGALGLDRPILVGHELGALIAERLLAERPDAARAVVLAGVPPGEIDEAEVQARLGPLDAGRSLADIAAAVVGAQVGAEADPVGVALAAACLSDVPDSTYRDMVGAMAGSGRPAPLTIPALLVSGDKEGAGRVAGARRAVLEGVGQMPFLERPSEFNAAVETFLAAL